MTPEIVDPGLNSAMGQIFFSELAGHLFTARETEAADRISKTYFAAERQQKLDHSQGGTIRLSDSPIDPGQPALSREELDSRTDALRSNGIVLLGDHFPLRTTSCPPHIAPLTCLRLQPPDFVRFMVHDIEALEAQGRVASMKLMLMVAYDW